MSMTWKHFEALAEALVQSGPQWHGLRMVSPQAGGWTEPEKAVWRACVHNVARACRRFNGAFDEARFYRACGFND